MICGTLVVGGASTCLLLVLEPQSPNSEAAVIAGFDIEVLGIDTFEEAHASLESQGFILMELVVLVAEDWGLICGNAREGGWA